MKNKNDWITLEEAYNHVLQDAVIARRAERELIGKFCTELVATRADTVITGGRNSKTIPLSEPLSGDTWRGFVRLLPHENAATGVRWKTGLDEFPISRLENISVHARQLYKFWRQSEDGLEAKRPNGRPKGSGYQSKDEPFLEKAKALLKEGRATSRTMAVELAIKDIPDTDKEFFRNASRKSVVHRLVGQLPGKTENK